jgi:hypothetical protein
VSHTVWRLRKQAPNCPRPTGQAVRMKHVVPPEWEQELVRVAAQVHLATGEDLEASLRWVSVEEQRDADAAFERRLEAPNVRVIRIGSTDPLAGVRAGDSYHGYWALVLPGQETMIHEASQIADEVEDYVIEDVWLRTAFAPKPGFLKNE